ncbi:31-O-demethyl-FK506 methyltransferase FkbM [Novipirellula galeiformis]|uniref:31-O-demethyl-FK506 methyltransferase FkbM n=1 Tax=Novipirellula galeiformis TaxID=2528004 RepID=A0A5C6CM81_9BACT|nr:FkbM family methyltransferase [Novipirellula galeiformis]TWU25462.1 31-O-demethyl-FK506 methyltransferase FkbM [Novipirellula galeiformis]
MQRMKFRSYKLLFENQASAESMVRQIDEFPSFFTPKVDRPLIIDCGANIGVSVLEWKTRWPGSEIICFEPDPFAFQILQKNIDLNDVPSVRCINAAVSDREDTVPFYGEVSARGDARGNSIDAAWGQREGTAESMVKCKRLSSYIAMRDVSFLKLDIEGAEQRVLVEIADQLDRVEAIYVEVHETDDSVEYNSAAQIEQLLKDTGFHVEAESRFSEHALPVHLDAWRDSVGARQVQLMGWR